MRRACVLWKPWQFVLAANGHLVMNKAEFTSCLPLSICVTLGKFLISVCLSFPIFKMEILIVSIF